MRPVALTSLAAVSVTRLCVAIAAAGFAGVLRVHTSLRAALAMAVGAAAMSVPNPQLTASPTVSAEVAYGPNSSSSSNRAEWAGSSNGSLAATAVIPTGMAEGSVFEAPTSLVPLFVLLFAFTAIIVACVVVCQRFRRGHKDPFAEMLQKKEAEARPYVEKYAAKGRVHSKIDDGAAYLTYPPRTRAHGDRAHTPRSVVTFADELPVARSSPLDRGRGETRQPAAADHIIVVKQLQGPMPLAADLQRQRLTVGSAADERGSRNQALSTGEPELRVALLENEELTIHSSDGHVFQVALVRARGSGGNLSEQGRKEAGHRAGASARVRSARPRGARNRTMSAGDALSCRGNAPSGRAVAERHAEGDGPVAHCPAAAVTGSSNSANQGVPAPSEQHRSTPGAVGGAARPKPRLLASSSESSQDDHECTSLLAKDTGSHPDSDKKLLGSFAPEEAAEHSR